MQVNVNFIETDEVKPPSAPTQPVSITPANIQISEWKHQNTALTQELVKQYISQYITYLRDVLGKYVLEWTKQVTFKFIETDTDTVGLDDMVSTGEAVSRWVRITVGAKAPLQRTLEYLSAESAKSCMIWLRYDNSALQHTVNDAFGANKFFDMEVSGVKYHALTVEITGLKLGES